MRLPELVALLRATESAVQVLDDRQLAMASGALVGDDVVLVPNYVVQGDLRPAAYVRIERPDGPNRTIRVAEVLATEPLGGGADLMAGLGVAFCRLEEAHGQPLGLDDARPATGTHLSLLHFPLGGAMRISRAVVTGTTASSVSFQAPTEPGSGGGALVDATGRLVAVHHSKSSTGECFGVLTAACIDLVRGRPELDALLHSIAETSAIVAVDPGLDARFASQDDGEEEPQPVLIRVQSSDVDLAPIDGVDVSSALGETVAATVTKEGLDALRRRPDVLAVDLSRSVGVLDLFKSIPAMGWAPPRATAERGEESLIALIDNGIDVRHGAFVVNGASKIEAYWDQTSGDTPAVGASPEAQRRADEANLKYGRLYLHADIDAIRAGQLPDTLPLADQCIHGTAVASIAGGVACGVGTGDFPGGVAPGARLVVVRFVHDLSPSGYATSHTDALGFIRDTATRLGRPVVVNISSGMNTGGHDGADPLEKACNGFCEPTGRVIVKSAGNEHTTNRHAKFEVPRGTAEEFLIETVDEEGGDVVEFWWQATSNYKMEIFLPDGSRSGEISRDFLEVRLRVPGGLLTGKLAPRLTRDANRTRARLKLDLTPDPGQRLPAGTWRVAFSGGEDMRPQPIHGWIESGPRSTRFVSPDEGCTVTIPGTTPSVICVGAIASKTPVSLYPASSEGPTAFGLEKPDIVAPGVDIQSAIAGTPGAVGVANSGTSYAAPHVTGAVALALSAAFKRDPAKVPFASEVAGALRDHTHDDFQVWDARRGYGPLDIPDFLALVEQTVADRDV